jgi:hypothetical protein
MYQFTKSKTDTAVVKRLLMNENHLQQAAAAEYCAGCET